MKPLEIPTQKRLKELFDYDRKSGLLRWTVGGRRKRKNRIAGTLRSDGYIKVGVDGEKYLAHRIIWVFVYKCCPEEIDHINHVGCDNRLENLRNVSRKENTKNIRVSTRNKSGVVGVHWQKRYCNWRVIIGVKGKTIHIGYFHDFNDAVRAREKANAKYGFHSNHGK